MKQRMLGRSILQVSEIGLGCWQLGGAIPRALNADLMQLALVAIPQNRCAGRA